MDSLLFIQPHDLRRLKQITPRRLETSPIQLSRDLYIITSVLTHHSDHWRGPSVVLILGCSSNVSRYDLSLGFRR